MTSDFKNIRTTLLHKVAALVRQAPVDLEQLAREMGVVEIAPREIDFDGYLAKRADGRLAIRYRADSSLTRRRFTIAHEIGHILIAQELGTEIQCPIARSQFHDSDEERLANRVASELLMPAAIMTEMLRHNDVSWDTIYMIARTFGVSTAAAAWRIDELDQIAYLAIRSSMRARCMIEFRMLGNLLFDCPPSTLLERLKSENAVQARQRTRHSVMVQINKRRCSFPLLGWIKEKGDHITEYFFGWRPYVDRCINLNWYM